MKRSVPTRFVLLASICCAIAWLNAQTNAQLLESPWRRVFGYDSDNAEHNKLSMPARFVLLPSICCIIVLINTQIGAQELQSPCPRIFTYDAPAGSTDRWYGVITLLSHEEISGIWLRILLDNPALQLGNWFGQVKTEDNKLFRVRDRNTILKPYAPLHITFYIKYDPNKPIPRLESIILNGHTICPESIATPATTTQLYTNPESNTASPIRLTQSFNQQSGTIQAGSNNDDDRFKGDFPHLSQQSTDANSNIECGTVAIQARPLLTYSQATIAGQFPWHVALYHSKRDGLDYTCGGSLISRHHVLTAAHCISKPKTHTVINPDNLLVYLGKYFLNRWSNPGVQTRHVAGIIRHPWYNSEMYLNDIAVIKLMESVDFTDFVRPVCLWNGDGDINRVVEENGIVVGWGYDEDGKLSEELTMLKMPIIAKDKCIQSLPEFYTRFTILNSYCAGFTNGTSACNGDSGGGMVFLKSTGNPNKKAYYLRGLISLSVALQNEAKCDSSHYVVFTDVARYLDFVKEAMKQ